jgi:hypothetical protein
MLAILTNTAELEEGQQDFSKIDATEISKLCKLIEDSLGKINNLSLELKELEHELNLFLNPIFTQDSVANDNDISSKFNLEETKERIYNKIAKICSQDSFNITAEHNIRNSFLKIEHYLFEGSDRSQAPEYILNSLALECLSLSKQLEELLDEVQAAQNYKLIESRTYTLKQEIMWMGVKTTEAILQIRNDILHQANRIN